MRRVLSPHQRLWVIGTLLVALVVRALIPAGFMPATDRPFSFQICPDGFPAALLGDAAGAAATPIPAAAHGDATMPAGHHHHGGAFAQDGAALAQAPVGGNEAGDYHDSGALAHAGHHHDGPLHNHGVAAGEHCVFAAAAGVFALAFAAAFFAPAATISAPDVDYFAPTFESRRFRIPQPRGPPALS